MSYSEYERTKRKRAKCKAEGRCIDCGKSLDRNPLRCDLCRRKHHNVDILYRKNLVGKCRKCFRPMPEHRVGMTECGWCRQDQTQRRW